MLGVLVTAAVVAGGWAYLHYGQHAGRPPAAVKKSAAALEPPRIASATPHSRPPEEQRKTLQEFKQPPFGISEDVFEAGARIYVAQCASCHGVPGRDARTTPAAPQLWRPLPHSRGIGVSSLPPGETFARIEDGVHPPAMPAYGHTLTSTQIWQVSLLLKNAAEPFPDPVETILASWR